MPAVYVDIRPDIFDRLRRVAADQRRRPGDQAAVLIEQALAALDQPPAPSEAEQAHHELAR